MSTKKYVSLAKLGLYDEKIKQYLADADTAALNTAKAYADGLASNYDAAGAAATAESNAKGYTDAEVAKANAAAAAAQSAADAAGTAAATADEKAVAAQNDVNALEAYVGTLPTETTATTVVAYVQEKTAGIATEGTVTELGNRVGNVEGDVAAIKGDYLKAADKTELEGKITAVETAISTEKTRAEGIEADLETRLSAVEGDYLKGEDKTELQDAIDLKAAQTALDAEIERATQAEAGLQTQINTIMNNPDAEGAINSINEFTKYVTDHGTIADGFRADIDQNKADIAAEVKRAGEAEAALAGRLDTLEAIDHEAYVGADTALKNELTGEIAKKADESALTAAVQALEGADSLMAGRLNAIEAQLGDGEGSVADLIADAKQAAIDAAAADATAKAAQALADAKADSDSKDAVVLAEAQKAATAVQTNLDTHTSNTDIHVTTDDKTKWNAALQASDITAGSANGTISVKGTDVSVTGLGTAAYKADTAFDAAGSADQALTDAKTYTNTEIAKFVECSEEDINDLFAAKA